MALQDFSDWLTLHTTNGSPWYAKRLAANDTLATKSHQAGPYMARDFLFSLFPALDDPTRKNPDIQLTAFVDSHGQSRDVRVVWYNNRIFDGVAKGRNETRITNWGGMASPLLDPESTGAIAVFAFNVAPENKSPLLHVWVCRNSSEEDLAEERLGSVEPGHHLIWTPAGLIEKQKDRAGTRILPCTLTPGEIPQSWFQEFPSGKELVRLVIERRHARNLSPDHRIMIRRACEFEMFRSIETVVVTPQISAGFQSIDSFLGLAQSVLQRRKSRSGRSLELHAREIFIEEGLREGVDFSHQPESEPGKKPDFLFPSEAAYKNPSFPESRLRLLAVKTTCKDRWRQVINEANRIRQKHLLTLQEGVSVRQFAEMEDAGIRLVVPNSLLKAYPEEIRSKLCSLQNFISQTRQAIND